VYTTFPLPPAGGALEYKERFGSTSRIKDVSPQCRMPPRLEMLLDIPAVGKDVQVKHAWNSEDRSVV
jgi:hypothetical protein